jgi:hypothetical protein
MIHSRRPDIFRVSHRSILKFFVYGFYAARGVELPNG